MSVLTSGSTYAWVAPLIDRLLEPDSEVPMTAHQMSWFVSLMALGGLVSALPAGLLSNYFGRKPVLLSVALLHIVSWLLILYLPSVAVLMAARLIQGLGFGIVFAITAIYLGEISDKNNRGALTCLNFISWWLGILISYSAGPFVSYRTFNYLLLGLNIPFALLFIWQPDTPYYYMMVNKETKAFKSLAWFRDTCSDDELREELEEIKTTLKEKKDSSAITDILRSKVNRRSIIFLLVLNIVRLSSGSAALVVYATKIFNLTPNAFIPSDMVTIILGLVFFGGGLVGLFLSDSVGRRPLFLISCVGALLCQLLAGTYYLVLFKFSIDISKYSWMALCLILLYAFFSTAGLNPVCSSYVSELFTSNTRSVACSLMSITASVFSFIMVLIFDYVNIYIGLFANFYINTLSLLVGFVYFYSVAPETKGKSFAEIHNELNEKNR